MRDASEWVSNIWRGWGERMMWVRGGVNGGETVLKGSSEWGKSWGGLVELNSKREVSEKKETKE